MTEIVHCTRDDSVEVLCGYLDRDAAIVLDGALDETTLASLREELSPFFESARPGRNDFAGFHTQRIGALMARSPTCRRLAVDPVVNATCDRFLAPHADGYQLHFTQAVRIGPGEGAQALHRDRGVWGGRVPRRIETQLSTIWAISGFTQDNGATRVVPGSHEWDKDREPEPHEILVAEMEPGSVLIYSGTVLHGGGSNSTDTHRLGVLLHYTLDWLRQEENQYLSCPPEIAKDLPPQLRALMGYSRAHDILGFFSSPTGPGEKGLELADPQRLFDKEALG
ncbi:MAG: mitomycin antibiotic biosynthesis protein [bacterium]|nr:mitomycin antibiotic biosynthesis protein [Deltaproteobacteria bacterium]MCP4905066.1 mitomycin antibiotic biosynthesis protein [bacterium]